MNYEETITIVLPDFLFGTFHVMTHGHLKTQGEQIRRIIERLSHLPCPEIRALPDPPREGPFWVLRLDLEREYLHELLEKSRHTQLDVSTIFCRVFYGLIRGNLHFHFLTPEDTHEMTRLELEKDFFKSSEFSNKSRAKKVNSAASRQHSKKV